MCFYHGEFGSIPGVPGMELAADEIINIIKGLENYQKVRFILTGGEVFLRNDIEDFLRFMVNEKIKYNIMTNGTILNKNYLDLIAQSDAFNISFSLDGLEKTNDTIRRKKGSFRKTMSTIEYFNSVNKRKIPVTIVMTISKDSYNDLPEMIHVAEKNKARLTVVHLQFLDKDIIEEHCRATEKAFGQVSDCSRWFAEKFTRKEVDKITENIRLSKILAWKKSVDIKFLPDLVEEHIHSYYLGKDYNQEKKCEFPCNQIVIAPYGEVYPCFPERFGFSIGNVRKEKISDIINSDRRKEFVNVIKNHGIFPGCLRCCSLKLKSPGKSS